MIPVRSYPLNSYLLRRLRRPPRFDAAAKVIEEVYPGEIVATPPIYMMPGDFEKITAVQHETTEEIERIRVEGQPREQGATRRLIYRDVLATPHGFYLANCGLQLSGGMRIGELLRARIHHEPKGFYATSQFSLRYFGHWLREALPSTLLKRPDEALYLPIPKAWRHAQSYADALGIDRLSADYVHFDEMVFADDLGHNSHQRARVREIYDRIQALCGESGAPGLYIRRGGSGAQRMLVNESEVIAALERRGFAVVSISDSLETIWKKAGGVPVVVSMEGSHHNHGLFAARPGALHVTINPADRFNTVFADSVAVFDARLGTVVAPRAEGGYVVDVASVLELLDRYGTPSVRL